jgi:hypothetical protein
MQITKQPEAILQILKKQPQARCEAKWLIFTLCPIKTNNLIIPTPR